MRGLFPTFAIAVAVLLGPTPFRRDGLASSAPLQNCAPRQPIGLAVEVVARNRLRATVTAGAGGLRELQITAPPQVRVSVPGRESGEGTTFSVSLPDRPPSIAFLIDALGDVQSVTVPFVVADDCGPWRSMAGAGATALRSAPPQPPSSPLLTLGPEAEGLPNRPPTEPFGLRHFPDGQISFVRVGNQIEVYLAANIDSYRLVGSDFENLEPEPKSLAGHALPILPRDGPLFLRDYAGLMGVVRLPGAAADHRLGFFHAEQRCDPKDGSRLRATVGLAESDNAGRSWRVIGPVITGLPIPGQDESVWPCYGFTGVGQPSAIVVGDFMYVYFTDWTPWILGGADSVHVARAPLGAARDPAAYRKFNGGAGWTSALGGPSTTVISRPDEESSYAALPSVSWNSYLQSFLAVVETGRGFAQSTSNDGIHWNAPRPIFPFPPDHKQDGKPWYSYPTLLDPGADSQQSTGRANTLYYSAGIWKGAPHRMIRRSAAFDSAAPWELRLRPGESRLLPPGPAWVCEGDIDVNGSPIYDSAGSTGAVLSVPAGATPAVVAPWGAVCEAATPSSLPQLLAARIQSMLAGGCGSRCADVRVVTLDGAGQFVKDQLPRGHVGPILSRGPWVCSGDLKVNDTPIYDGEESTGAVVAIPAGAPPTQLAAPFGGTCEAADPSNPAALLNAKIQTMFDRGCGGSCNGVRVVVLDTTGRISRDQLPAGYLGPPLTVAPWVCTGDIQVNDVPFYDSDASTGLVLSVPSGAGNARIRTPWGASCTAALDQDPETIVNSKVTELLAAGCAGRCGAVRVVYIDQNGAFVRESWRR